jgi:hypothetical protein
MGCFEKIFLCIADNLLKYNQINFSEASSSIEILNPDDFPYCAQATFF